MKPEIDFIDTGWVIGNGFATHYPCNPGQMFNSAISLQLGHTYNVGFEVFDWVSNGVLVKLGTTAGTNRVANGYYNEELICADNTVVTFFSDGFLSIKNMVIYDVNQDSVPLTFAFNEHNKLWTETQSIVPDIMQAYGTDFFTFKDGALWKHNVNPIRNNFYGVQYPSQITFYLNSDLGTIKLLSNIVLESNKKWWVQNIVIKPYSGKSFGMQSRIKIGKFKALYGVFYADFLRNMLDPRWGTQIEALLYGEELIGRIAAITIQNDDTDEVLLYKVQVKYTPQMLTP